MKLLKMYCLEGQGLTPDQCIELKEALELDHIIQVKANNQLQGIQYPVFEFETVD